MAGAYRRTAKADNGVPPRLAGRVVEVLAESATQQDSFLCRLLPTNELHHIPRAWFAQPNTPIRPATPAGWKTDAQPDVVRPRQTHHPAEGAHLISRALWRVAWRNPPDHAEVTLARTAAAACG